MIKKLVHSIRILIVVILIVQLTGCGTIFYPERKGQKGGTIDSGIVVLDAMWFLVFIIPGIIAFIVDANNGTIYLPGGGNPPFARTENDINATVQNAGEALKTAGRNAASSIRQALQ